MSAHSFIAELHAQNQKSADECKKVPGAFPVGGVNGPTPAEQVETPKTRTATFRTKRKTSTGFEASVGKVWTATSTDEPPLKRKRTTPSTRSGTTTPQPQKSKAAKGTPPRPSVEDDLLESVTKVVMGAPANGTDGLFNSMRKATTARGRTDEDDDSFLEAVAAKMKEQEAKMWSGMVKKRKRDSDTSDDQCAPSRPAKKVPIAPSQARKKARQTLTQVEGDVITEHAYTPEREMRSNKRASPANEYIEGILQRADAKRQKASRRSGILAK